MASQMCMALDMYMASRVTPRKAVGLHQVWSTVRFGARLATGGESAHMGWARTTNHVDSKVHVCIMYNCLTQFHIWVSWLNQISLVFDKQTWIVGF